MRVEVCRKLRMVEVVCSIDQHNGASTSIFVLSPSFLLFSVVWRVCQFQGLFRLLRLFLSNGIRDLCFHPLQQKQKLVLLLLNRIFRGPSLRGGSMRREKSGLSRLRGQCLNTH
ncbi:hypothetical protein GFGA_1c0567 [Gluconobacter frateurii NBRC 103465]|nr:hypothetical protein GFGA_1c0567 [Gluconobacter frateurii NBRC 103465]